MLHMPSHLTLRTPCRYGTLLGVTFGTPSAMTPLMTTDTTKTMMMAAVEKMIQRAAVKLARLAGGSLDAGDLAQIGRIAALKAAETFDTAGGASFRTYCWHPVHETMRREAVASRSAAGTVTVLRAHDVSLSAPARAGNAASDDNGESTVGDTFADSVDLEERVAKAQFEARVRSIVARVRAEQDNSALFDDLLARLMSSHFAGEGLRLRSEISLEELAVKHGCSKQNVSQREKKIRARLAEVLAPVSAEA